jgi:hypothetical protein
MSRKLNLKPNSFGKMLYSSPGGGCDGTSNNKSGGDGGGIGSSISSRGSSLCPHSTAKLSLTSSTPTCYLGGQGVTI